MARAAPGKADNEWGPWVLHDGKGCPLRAGTIAEVVCEDGFGFAMTRISVVMGGSYSSWDWSFYPELKRITRYREKRPKGLKVLEESLIQKPQKRPVDEPVA